MIANELLYMRVSCHSTRYVVYTHLLTVCVAVLAVMLLNTHCTIHSSATCMYRCCSLCICMLHPAFILPPSLPHFILPFLLPLSFHSSSSSRLSSSHSPWSGFHPGDLGPGLLRRTPCVPLLPRPLQMQQCCPLQRLLVSAGHVCRQ